MAAGGGVGERLRVLVVSFGPVDKGSADDAREGRRYAGKLADALADAAHGWGRRDGVAGEVGGLEVVPLVDERVTAIGDAAGHEQAREIGRRHRADLVVWGSA